MSTNGQEETVDVNIDGQAHAVPKGLNMIEAARMAGKEVPHYCYHPKLSVVGNCRMCMIELGMPMKDRSTGEPVLDENGAQKIGWMPKPAIACSTKAASGMHVRTDSEAVREYRNSVTEFLLLNHPLDCPICDQAGECRLQEFSAQYGRGYSRLDHEKLVKPKRTRIGPRVMLDDERCILCSRCVRFSQEIVGDDVLGFTDRGSYSTLTTYPGRELDNNYSLNTVDICPVGALTNTDFRFKMRVWFLRPVQSICAESSVGANTQVWSREGKIYRVTPRRNDAVNDTWMTDSGRARYKEVESADRLQRYTIDGMDAPAASACAKAAEHLAAGGAAVVGSARLSVEEQFLMKTIAERAGAETHLVSHYGEGDGILLSEDRTPNLRGALLTGLIGDLPPPDLSALAESIEAGRVSTVFAAYEDVAALGLGEDLRANVDLIYLGAHANGASAAADVVLPGLTVFEKDGCFVNQNFRLQKFNRAVPGPEGIAPDVASLEAVAASLGGEKPELMTPDVIWERISNALETFRGLGFRSLPDDGLPLDPGPLAELPFVESKNLKYDPAAFREAPAAAEAGVS